MIGTSVTKELRLYGFLAWKQKHYFLDLELDCIVLKIKSMKIKSMKLVSLKNFVGT